jgi:hypothetical protein
MKFNVRRRSIFFVFLIAIFLFYGCGKEEKYPIEPIIIFKSVSPYNNSNFKLVLGFTDGDGDIGLERGDTTGVFASGSKYFYNCFISFYRKNGDVFDTLDFIPPFYYRIPVITPKERNKNVKGDIEINVQGYLVSGLADTMIVDVYIADRALHESNKVTSTEFILTKQ